MIKKLVITSLLMTLIPLSGIFAYSSPGNPSGYINDFAQVLDIEIRQALETKLVGFEQETSNEIVVATIANLGGDYIENYAVELFEEWQIGKADQDNGTLLLLAIEDRKLRIEIGYGLEGALPDSVAASIITDMTPALKNGNYDAAITLAVDNIISATRGEYKEEGSDGDTNNIDPFFFIFLPIIIFQWFAAIFARSKSWWAGGVVGIIAAVIISLISSLALVFTLLLILGLGLFGLLLDYLVSKAYSRAKNSGVKPPWWAGGSSGRSSGGGSFGGFGGGSSGGGGASGSW